MPSDPRDPKSTGRRGRDSASDMGSTGGRNSRDQDRWASTDDRWTTEGRRVRYGQGSTRYRYSDDHDWRSTDFGGDNAGAGLDGEGRRERRRTRDDERGRGRSAGNRSARTGGTGGPGGDDDSPATGRADRPRGLRGRPLMLVAACAAGGVLATSGLSYAAVDHYTSTIARQEVFSAITAERPADDDGLNIMVVGSDNREGISEERRLELKLGLADFGRHTDTILIAHVASNGAVDVVSIPRDSEVTIGAYTDAEGVQWDESESKLNAAFGIGGAPMLVETFEQNAGVRIDHYLEVDFNGFIDIVDALGGVEVCSPVAVDDELSGLRIPAGQSTVDGAMGLSYVRARYFDPMADFGRMQRQQAFLAGMFSKAVSSDVLLNPARINSVVSAGLASLSGDETLDQDRIKGLIATLKGTDPGAVRFLTLPTSGDTMVDDGGTAVAWDEQATSAIFTGLKGSGSVFEGIREALANLPQVEVPASEVGVTVLNGTGVPGAAGSAAERFTKAGFPVAEIANGELTDRTLIEIDPNYAEGRATLTTALPDAQVREVAGLGPVAHVTIGDDFRGLAGFRVKGAQPNQEADDEVRPNRTAADDLCSQ